MNSMAIRKAATRRSRERAEHAARWLLAFSGAKPSTQFACRVFGTNRPAVRKATEELQNGNGHAPAPPSLDEVVRWWAAATDADRAAFVRCVGVGAVWRATEVNLG
jgi:hypothetical protein